MGRKRLALAWWVLGLVSFGPLVGRGAEPSPDVVYLGQCRQWQVYSSGWGDHCPLARELVRQAFLIAARDELGLTTRDAWLGAPLPREGDNAPWEFTAQPQDPTPVKLRRGFASQQTELFSQELRKPVRGSNWIDYRRLTEAQERLSRSEYVEVLKQAGYAGQRSTSVGDVAVPANVESLLSQMNFLAQFRALRELHALVRAQGESPAVLGALARGYAHLGLLTECYWHPAHKVFKARALLYAQRMLAQTSEPLLALWHRAYAAALAGDELWAVRELRDADKGWQALAEGDRPTKPAWLPLIEALCQYRVEAFSMPLADPQLLPLANLLRFITVEHAGGQTWAVKMAVDTLPILPDCYRMHDSLCQFGGVALLHSATMEPIERLGQNLYTWVGAMPGLPAEVRAALPRAASLGEFWRGLLPGKPAYEAEDEFPRRRRLTEALLKTGDVPAASDLGEPSWDSLGLLIRELSFLQVYRRADFEGSYLGLPSDQWLDSAKPLVEGHPYQTVLETYRGDHEQAQQAIARLPQLEVAGLEGTGYALYFKTQGLREGDPTPMFREILRNLDFLARDLIVTIRYYGAAGNETDRKWLGQTLLCLNRRSPMGRRVLVETDWDGIQKQLPEWMETASQYPGLASALAKTFLQLERLDEAEPLLQAAQERVPFDLAIRQQRAQIHEQRGQHERWRATLKEQLQQPDYYLDHASVQSEIAADYTKHKQWELALPYAEGAAGSGSAWGMRSAACCYEGLQRFEEAEQMLRGVAERYEDSLSWYFFCRRTGHGDRLAARQAVQPAEVYRTQQGLAGSYDFVAYYLLEDQPELARRELEHAVFNFRHGDDAVWLALIHDQLGNAAQRDLAWDQAKELAANQSGLLGSTSNGIFSLTLLVQQDLAEGGQGKIDLDRVEQFLEPLEELDRFCFCYALGQYLSLHGQPEAAQRYWRRCMAWPNFAARYRTLAGAALLDQGISPADYLELFQPAPEVEPSPQSQEEGGAGREEKQGG